MDHDIIPDSPAYYAAIKAELEQKFPIGSQATINDPPHQFTELSGLDHGRHVTIVEIPDPAISRQRFGYESMVIVEFNGGFRLNIQSYKLRPEQTPA